MVEDLIVRRPRPIVSLSTAAAALLVAGVTLATQVGDAQPGGVHVAAAATPAPSPSSSSSPGSPSAIDPNLTAAIKAKMSQSTSSSYGVVVDIEGVGRVVDVNGTRSLLPASTEKLFTTLPMLLNRAQDVLVTTVGATAAPAGGVVHGDLVVRTAGDPTLMGMDVVSLAKQVHAAGVHRVTGRIVLDAGSLPSARTRSGWKSSYVPWDIGPLAPFPVHFDTWQTSSWYVGHPTAGNLVLLRRQLAKAGVKVVGGTATTRGASMATVLARHASTSMARVVRHTLRQSDNFAAEQMLSIQGWGPIDDVIRAAGSDGTATDGSGLSLQDRRTAAGEVALLEYAHGTSAANLLVGSLPVACQVGTLKHEFCDTIGAGKVFAKTGTLDHVKALAGYTTDAKGRWVTFAFLTNGDSSTSKASLAIDRAVLVLRRYAG
jgi:D-alanyl-D-alanine carboxypeptidase/D-alanyl-D-alanine-endopeptidase (penicillin-binding protein 4)